MSCSVNRSSAQPFGNKVFLRGTSTDVLVRIVNTASPSTNALTISGTGVITTSGGLVSSTADTITSGGVIVPVTLFVNSIGWAAVGAGTQLLWTADANYTVVSVVANCITPASAQADFTVARTRGGVSDVQQLSAPISLNGATAKTAVSGTLVGGATNQLTTGDGISVTLAGAATSLVNGQVTIRLQRR